MEKNKKTKILHLELPSDSRMLFMSDIHGDIQLFKEALEQAHFSEKDYLFVIGDMIEKADEWDNKKMLDFIIELNQNEKVFFMAGNCDEIFRFILPPLDKKKFLYYALELKKSILNDLAKDMDFPLSEDMDIDAFVSKVTRTYKAYFSFIDSLPDVIFINEELVLVHGGIQDIHSIPSSAIDVLKFDRFLEVCPTQPIPMLVGHNPTRNYRTDVASVNPIFDYKKNVICLDGGNNVVKGGQLNVVILDSLKNKKFSFFALDHYPKYIIKDDICYEEPQNLFSMRFGKNEVDVLAKDLDFYLVKPKGSLDELWVHEEFMIFSEGKAYCYEGSNAFLNLKKGDQISIIKKAQPYSLVKHKGILGLIESKYLYDESI